MVRSALVILLAAVSCLSAAPLVDHSSTWRYRKGTAAPASNWKTVADAGLDAQWLSGPGGFGYGDGDDATILTDMRNLYGTIYIRRTFTTDGSLPAGEHLFLRVDYDDGFVAYLDGEEVARRNAPGNPGLEPAASDNATDDHEASGGNNDPQPVEVIDLGAIGSRLVAGEHVFALIGLNDTDGSSDFSLIADLYTDVAPPSEGFPVSGNITADTVWTKANSPYVVVGNVTVNPGVTLTIEPGVEVRFNQGLGLTCNGRLMAEGTQAEHIVFTRSLAATSWTRLSLNGPEESSFRYCDISYAASGGNVRGNNTDVLLDHCVFTQTTEQLVTLDDSSCTIQYCEFPSIQNNELLHFNDMPPNGHALLAHNRFGTPGIPATTGYNDVVDFTGGNRPGPIVQFIGNLFLSGVDDGFDMDGTDAHIEGNFFFNIRQDAARDSTSSCITTGADGGATSQLVICRNFFYNCEHALLLKDSGTALVQNNTIVRVTPNAIAEQPPGVILFGEPHRGDPYGDGALFQGNIAADLQIADPWPLVDDSGAFLRVVQSLVQGFPQTGPGNLVGDPLFVDASNVTETNILEKLALQPASPCRGSGPNGLDMGALVPAGPTISGEPPGLTSSRSATLVIAGPGIWAYRWRVDGGPWSSEVSLVPQSIWDGAPFTAAMLDAAPPIQLNGLADGPHSVEVLGKNSAAVWQSVPTISRSWTVEGGGGPDSDGDGMLDAWENANGFDPLDPADGGEDADGDGTSNRDEFVQGTDPRDLRSVLSLAVAPRTNGGVELSFEGVVGHSYVLEVSETLVADSWRELRIFPAIIEAGLQSTDDAEAGLFPRRFYRIATTRP